MNSSREKTFRFIIAGEIGLLVLLILFLFLPSPSLLFLPVSQSGKASSSEAEDYIKWVDFDVTARAMEDAFRYDLNTCQSAVSYTHLDVYKRQQEERFSQSPASNCHPDDGYH